MLAKPLSPLAEVVKAFLLHVKTVMIMRLALPRLEEDDPQKMVMWLAKVLVVQTWLSRCHCNEVGRFREMRLGCGFSLGWSVVIRRLCSIVGVSFFLVAGVGWTPVMEKAVWPTVCCFRIGDSCGSPVMENQNRKQRTTQMACFVNTLRRLSLLKNRCAISVPF